jgi:hypothetical protein
MAIEATMTGHFEIKDAMAALGNWNVAFAGKDNESSVRLDLDFATDLPPRDAATLRCAVTDSEFPVGKRIREYPYRFQDTRPVVQLADQRGGVCESRICSYARTRARAFARSHAHLPVSARPFFARPDAPGEKHSDAGGARLDTTRSDIMLETLGRPRAAAGGGGGGGGAGGHAGHGDSARR